MSGTADEGSAASQSSTTDETSSAGGASDTAGQGTTSGSPGSVASSESTLMTDATTDGPGDSPCGSAGDPEGMVCIEGGEFGVPGAMRSVGPFWLDLTEVTVAAYSVCVSELACSEPTASAGCNWAGVGRAIHPINCVDWQQANEYCVWVGKRLPTEWEWEWAARGRSEGRTYPWGEQPPSCARAVMNEASEGGAGCGAGGTQVVGSRAAGVSRDGVSDLGGNVWEWTDSWFDASRQARVLRGGGWFFNDPNNLRVDYRQSVNPAFRSNRDGFRCAKSP